MLIRGDARQLPLQDASVHCVVTSPPYFGLRNYGSDAQIGLEPTPAAYVASLVTVFAEVWRVLRDDGTVWLNLGDSYAAHEGQRKVTDHAGPKQRSDIGSIGAPSRFVADLKAKDLCGIPWRVAFALQAAGWYLRSDIIWHKKAPMPESVTDRPTKAHEYVFLLAKQERYYYDAQAIAEPVSREWDESNGGNLSPKGVHKANGAMRERGGAYPVCKGTRNKRTVWTLGPESFTGTRTVRQVRVSWDESDGDTTRITSPGCPVHGDRAVLAAKALCGGRGVDQETGTEHSDSRLAPMPLLDCVPIALRPDDYSEDGTTDSSVLSHAPLASPHSTGSRRMGRARLTTSPCSVSVETPAGTDGTSTAQPWSAAGSHMPESNTPDSGGLAVAALAETLGCTVGTCSCDYYRITTEQSDHFATMPEALVEPCILAGCPLGGLVCDPFVGSGTVVAVAERLGRQGVGVDLTYQTLAAERTAQRGLRFDVAACP